MVYEMLLAVLPFLISIMLDFIVGNSLQNYADILFNYFDFLLKSINTFSFAAIVALISFWYVNLRGPSIICSPLNWIFIGHSGLSMIVSDFVLSNSGSSTGIINVIFMNLKCVSCESTQRHYPTNQRFFAFMEEFDFNKITGGHVFQSLDYPIRPFSIEKGASSLKANFMFTSDDEHYRFRKGEYLIELFILLAGERNPIKILEQKMIIENDLPEYGMPGNAKKSKNHDPLDTVLKI